MVNGEVNEEIYHKALTYLPLLIFLLLVCIAFLIFQMSGEPETVREFIAHDGAICHKDWPLKCGETLYDCENGLEYYCETNVISKKVMK